MCRNMAPILDSFSGIRNSVDGFLRPLLQVVREGRANVLPLHGRQESTHGSVGLLVIIGLRISIASSLICACYDGEALQVVKTCSPVKIHVTI